MTCDSQLYVILIPNCKHFIFFCQIGFLFCHVFIYHVNECINVAWDLKFFLSLLYRVTFIFSHEYIHFALYWPRFEEQEVPGSRSFFTEIIASISDIKFAKDGRYILSRDYMTLKVFSFFGIYFSIQVHYFNTDFAVVS